MLDDVERGARRELREEAGIIDGRPARRGRRGAARLPRRGGRRRKRRDGNEAGESNCPQVILLPDKVWTEAPDGGAEPAAVDQSTGNSTERWPGADEVADSAR